MNTSEHPVIRKCNKIVFRIVIPLLVVAIIFYVFRSPKVIQLNENYYLSGTEIRVSGGNTVVGPGELRLWGRYPWVYGTIGPDAFVLDLSENKVKLFESYEAQFASGKGEFYQFLQDHTLSLVDCVPVSELFEGTHAKKLRTLLKESVSKPVQPFWSAVKDGVSKAGKGGN